MKPTIKLFFQYEFEDGAYVQVFLSSDAKSQEVLLMLEEFIKLKRAEITKLMPAKDEP